MRIIDRIAANLTKKEVPSYFRAQAKELGKLLPYETILNKNRPLFLLSDGALGVMWEIDAIAHEAVEVSELSRRLESFSKVFLTASRFALNFQVIYDSVPCYKIAKPSWFDAPQTFEQKIVKHRIECIENEAKNTAQDDLRLMTRKLYLTLRLAHLKEAKTNEKHLGAETDFASRRLAELEAEIDTIATEVEGTFMRAKTKFKICNQPEFLSVTKGIFHSEEFQK